MGGLTAFFSVETLNGWSHVTFIKTIEGMEASASPRCYAPNSAGSSDQVYAAKQGSASGCHLQGFHKGNTAARSLHGAQLPKVLSHRQSRLLWLQEDFRYR